MCMVRDATRILLVEILFDTRIIVMYGVWHEECLVKTFHLSIRVKSPTERYVNCGMKENISFDFYLRV